MVVNLVGLVCVFRSRQKYKAKGMEFLRAGNKMQAMECFQKCVDITPEMALKVMQVRRGLHFLTPGQVFFFDGRFGKHISKRFEIQKHFCTK